MSDKVTYSQKVKFFNKDGDSETKEIQFTDYDDFVTKVQQHVNNTPFMLMNPDSPWEDIKQVSQLSNTLTVVPLIQQMTNTSAQQPNELTSRSTLQHFLRTHETKNQYFMNNIDYRKRLNTEIHNFIQTTKDMILFEKLVDKLEKLLSQQSFSSANNQYYLEWILSLASLGSELPTTLASRVKRLSQYIVDSILYT